MRLSGMKSFFKKIKENIVPICQLVLLVIILFLPSWMNLTELITPPALKLSQDWVEYVLFFAWENGNIAIGLVLTSINLFIMRTMNKEHIFNRGNGYKNYPYWWYWICSKILGYMKCNLKYVPIYMQFKLVLRDTFEEYECGEYARKEDDKITVQKINCEQNSDEINIMIADTYELSERQLPLLNKGNPTIIITRDNKNDYNRYDSPELVKTVVNVVRGLSKNFLVVNIFATTNPLNTKKIVQEAFKLGGRDIIEKIIVFQQSNDEIRKFEEKGIQVYKR